MISASTRIREAIIERLELQDWLPVRTVRRQPRPQLQETSLPALLVVFVDETETPEDQANTGQPRFVSDITIGISVVVGEQQPQILGEDVDDIVERIRLKLLTDPTFVRGVDPSKDRDDPERYPLFEAVTRVRRGCLFPQDGSTYFAEGRLELTFQVRTQYDPVIPDILEHVIITARPVGAGAGSPAIGLTIDIPTN